MAGDNKMSLAKARAENKLDQFIAEREGEASNKKAFNQALKAMARKSPKAPKASSEGNRDD